MILELDKGNFQEILQIYLRKDTIFPLILAVIQGKQSGWIFVDDPDHPAYAIIITKFGFMQFVDLENGDNFGKDIIEFLASPNTVIPNYLLWYAPPYQAQKLLDRVMPEFVQRRKRTRFIFNKQNIENPIECPTGFEVRLLDRSLMKKTAHFKLDISSRFWTSTDDFLAHGFGACVMKDDEIVSLCYSACVVNNLSEIDVVTKTEYRGLQLATLAAQKFIYECIHRGISPTWDCFLNNSASMKLASRLGFIQTISYPFYSFNTPVNLAAGVD